MQRAKRTGASEGADTNTYKEQLKHKLPALNVMICSFPNQETVGAVASTARTMVQRLQIRVSGPAAVDTGTQDGGSCNTALFTVCLPRHRKE